MTQEAVSPDSAFLKLKKIQHKHTLAKRVLSQSFESRYHIEFSCEWGYLRRVLNAATLLLEP